MFGETGTQSGGKVTDTDGMELRVVLGGRDLSSRLAEIEETGRRAMTETDVRIIATLCAEDALRSRDAEMQGLLQQSEDRASELQQVAAGVSQVSQRLDDERTEHRRSLGELALKLHGLEVLAARLADTVAQVLQEPEVRKVVEVCVAQALTSRDVLLEEMRKQMSVQSEGLKEHSSQLEGECTARKLDLADVASKLVLEVDAQARLKDEVTRLSDRVGVGIARSDLLEASVGKASSELASKVSDAADAQVKLKEDIATAREKLQAVIARSDLLEVSLGKTSTEFRGAHAALEAQVAEKIRRLSDDFAPVERLAGDLARVEASFAAEAGRREASFQAAESKINVALELATGVKGDLAQAEARAVAVAESAVAAEAILREEGLRASDAKASSAAAALDAAARAMEAAAAERGARGDSMKEADIRSSQTLLAELGAERSARTEAVACLEENAAAAERRHEGRCQAVEVEAAAKLRQAQEAWSAEARAGEIAMNALSDNLQELEYGLSSHTHDLQFSGHAGPSPLEASSKQSVVPSRPAGPAPRSPSGTGASAARTLSSTLSSTPRSQTVPFDMHSR